MHSSGCLCSVCWAHNYCDALALFPLTSAELSQPFIDYYAYSDYTKEFIIENQHTDRVGLDD